MEIRRLGWAGIEVTADGCTLLVDYVHGGAASQLDLPEGALVRPQRRAAAALITHLHADHTDVSAIESATRPDAVVLRPAAFVGTAEEAVWTATQETALTASALRTQIVSEWESTTVGPFTVTAVPAVDGLGDPQLNWVIEAHGQRIFHGGDTMFHGYWWLIARRLGPLDVAALPINGAVVNFPHLQPASPLPAALTPEQALQAAAILNTHTVVPMHFGVHRPPFYVEEPDPLTRLTSLAAYTSQRVVTLQPGDAFPMAA